ncbi:MAG: hypothetical protein RR249_03885, partial [Tannerellaceae bacterium]
TKGWRAPRIREAYYLYSNRTMFLNRFNFSEVETNSRMYSSTEQFPNHTTDFLWAGFGITPNNASNWPKNNPYIFFRCVREIQ